MDEITKAYIAGVMDCDGSFMIVGRPDGKRFEPRAAVAQVTPQIPYFMKETFGGDIQYQEQQPPKRNRYLWRISCVGAVAVAKCTLKYLLIKQPRARLILELRSFQAAKFKTYSYWYELEHPNWSREKLITTREAQKLIGYKHFGSVKQAIKTRVLLALPGKSGILAPRIPQGQAIWLRSIKNSKANGRLPTIPPPLVEKRKSAWRQMKRLNRRGC